MKIKTTLLAGALFTSASFGGHAQDSVAPAPAASGTLTPAFVSQYMFRGARLGGFSFEPAAEYDAGGFALGLWASIPLADKVAGQSDPEIDPYGSYTFDLIKNTLSLQPGFTLYTYPDADRSDGFYRLTFEPNLALNYVVSGVKLTPKLYYDVVLRQATYEVTATWAVPLKAVGTELDFTGTAGTFKATEAVEHADPSVKNWGDYWLVGVALPFQVTTSAKLTIGFAYTRGSGNFFKQATAPRTENPAAVGRGVLTASYAWTF